jgi:hypothetical protein
MSISHDLRICSRPTVMAPYGDGTMISLVVVSLPQVALACGSDQLKSAGPVRARWCLLFRDVESVIDHYFGLLSADVLPSDAFCPTAVHGSTVGEALERFDGYLGWASRRSTQSTQPVCRWR